LAESALNTYVFTQPAEERARVIVEDVKRSRADGFIYMHNWGCNYESAPATLICDIVKREIGIPTTIIEMGELVRMESTEYSQNRTEAFIEMIRLTSP
jgi:benzoyl-CoA reductase/2-hydroxyglutaryl-CoA dehydratase subunit BcrC/BadD/HgdB